MKIEEYIAWKASRGDAGTWDIDKCVAADALVKQVTLGYAKDWVALNVHKDAQELLMGFLSVHFGSGEVDDFLMKIKAYPSWV